MKAPDFAYERPETLEDALKLLSATDKDVLPLAGGQSLVPMLNLRLTQPDMLVDLNGLPGLAGISEEGDMVRIGALTRHAQVESSEIVSRHLPLIAAAMGEIAHPAVRHRGTFGGSLAMADPAAELPACCLAYAAIIVVQGNSGERRVAADDFFKGAFATALEPGELITAVELNKRGGRTDHFGFAELARRKGDYAMAGLAVAVSGTDSVEEARMAYFGVADRPVRAGPAEQALAGASLPLTKDAVAAAADKAADGIDFAGDLHASEKLKAHYAGVLAGRVLSELMPGDSHG